MLSNNMQFVSWCGEEVREELTQTGKCFSGRVSRGRNPKFKVDRGRNRARLCIERSKLSPQ